MSEIKVGSEWASIADRKFTILAIDEDKLFIKYGNGEHRLISEKDFEVLCKPAPVRRTVWLNVYEDDVTRHSTKNGADWMATDALLWQQEVELIDPREGEKQ